MAREELAGLPQNPNYGGGCFRRGVRLTNAPGRASGDLEDGMHGMRCTVVHDGEHILNIETDLPRLPMNTCAGAVIPLRELIGLPLSTPFAWYYGEGRAARNCTHLYDLVWYTIAQAARPDEAVRQYEVVVPDTPGGGPETATLFRDGVKALEWTIENGLITAPAHYDRQPVLRGLTRWALVNLKGDALEAAMVLQKGYFVAGSRRIGHEAMVGPIAGREAFLKNVCWSFTSPQFEQAVRINSFRDFTDPEALLAFR